MKVQHELNQKLGVLIMNKLMIATVLTASVVVVQPAFADYDSVGSAVIGSVAGAVIGHAFGGRQGAAVGAAIGGVSGAIISSNQPRSYNQSSYERTPVTNTQSTQSYYDEPVQQSYYQQPVQQAYYQERPRVAYYSTAYYPVREQVVYPVRYTEYLGYRHHRDNGWHRGWDHDRDYDRHDDDRRDRGYSNY